MEPEAPSHARGRAHDAEGTGPHRRPRRYGTAQVTRTARRRRQRQADVSGSRGKLKALGLRPVLLTGDNEATARAVAAEIGIDDVIAEVMPSDKAAVVKRLQAEGRVVAMAGDGVNDAPALAQADLGLSIGTGTDVAIEASDLTLVSGDLRAAADAIRLSRRDPADDQAEPRLGLWLQHRGASARRGGLPQPGDRRRRDGALQRLRGRQRAAPAALRSEVSWVSQTPYLAWAAAVGAAGCGRCATAV